jgi:hypothetical protein
VGPAWRRFEIDLSADRDDADIHQAESGGIPLNRGRQVLLRLDVDIKLTANTSGDRLRVESSRFRVWPEGGRLPVFRYEFELSMEARSHPAAHIQVHGSHPELEKLMKSRGLKTPDITTLHFPVGGTRFRPCLEDVLEMLIVELGVDPLPNRATALAALAEGRLA